MPVIQVNSRDVHYQQLNETASETVILIHGMFSNLAVYYFNIAPILAQKFRVVMYDMKGHGMSARAASGYQLEAMVDDLLALMYALNITHAHLAGYSFGALVAMKMAMQHPERIGKLSVIEGPDPAEEKTLELVDNYDRNFLVNYVNNYTDNVVMKMGKRQFEKNHRMYEYLFHETTIRDDMRAEHLFFKDAAVEAIPHTTLLMYGNESKCRDTGEVLQRRMKDAKLLLIEGDHNVPIQQPVAVGNALTSFFEN